MTTIRIRAVPVGAAIHLTRRALALGPRFTYAGVLGLLGDWWDAGAAGWDALDREGRLVPDTTHPFTWALSILESQPRA